MGTVDGQPTTLARDGWQVTDTRSGQCIELQGSLFPVAVRRDALQRLAALAEHSAGSRGPGLHA